jgi:hypothetical protein
VVWLAMTTSALAANWPRFPTDAELRAAADEATARQNGRLLYTSGPIPWHDPARLAAGHDPIAVSGALLAMAHEVGGGAISVTGQVVGGAPTTVVGTGLQLYFADGEFVFATMPPRAGDEFRPALEVSGAAALAWSLRSEAAVRAWVDRHFAPRPDGYGYVRGFPAVTTSPLPIEVIVGGGVAAVVVAGAAIARRRRRAFPPANNDDGNDDSDDGTEDDVVGHVLQLARDQVTLAPGTSTVVPVAVWRVRRSGAVEPEPDATITARSDGGATVTPASAAGPGVALSLTAGDGADGPCEIVVTVQAGAGDRVSTKEARITVDVEGGYTMVFS